MANTRSIRSNTHRDAVTRQRKKGLRIAAMVLVLGAVIAALTSMNRPAFRGGSNS
ncbi:MAG: hypothetical protein KGH73_07680 [Xanthomonadaceae bacterium]|nr:hypothetical protein [Xanthomonadaceae bacterium]